MNRISSKDGIDMWLEAAQDEADWIKFSRNNFVIYVH